MLDFDWRLYLEQDVRCPQSIGWILRAKDLAKGRQRLALRSPQICTEFGQLRSNARIDRLASSGNGRHERGVPLPPADRVIVDV